LVHIYKGIILMKKGFLLRLCLITLTIIILSGCDLAYNEQQILTGTVTITGPNPPTVGDVLTAAYTGGNGKGTASWEWLCGNDVISGAASNTYRIISSDVGKTIKARVKYTNNSGSVTSAATAAVSSSSFVAVTSITGYPTAGTAGTPLPLTGTVAPANATNKTIVWSVASAGTTGAVVNGTTLNTAAAGTVTVRATITNGTAVGTAYTQDINITIAFMAVTSITGVPATGTAGIPLELTGAVAPANATNRAIVWSVASAGTTGAVVNGTTLSTTATGTVTVRATIANGTAVGTAYTQDIGITITFVPVSDITGVPTTGTTGTPISLSGIVVPANATNKNIVWSVTDTASGASVSLIGNILTPTLATTASGSNNVVKVLATIANGLAVGTNYTRGFDIAIDAFFPVTDITIAETTVSVGSSLTLTGTVAPAHATNQTIKWSVISTTSGVSVSINANTLKSAAGTGTGTATVRATITYGKARGTDYTQDFNIRIQ
jgi:endo-1,4-beta-xylanase